MTVLRQQFPNQLSQPQLQADDHKGQDRDLSGTEAAGSLTKTVEVEHLDHNTPVLTGIILSSSRVFLLIGVSRGYLDMAKIQSILLKYNPCP